ncbi:hypothetical protein B7R22_16870 [Subtercola boreus]|uniref:DUF427 domain-containing protein n=1 Tax=Subtercola boreus TaxID=120213 RepID=A0A3E0VQE2_9MICO|nr:DUF427 domain-containing protein [Subtercola boreus]RFA12106.1 hypothetical protein B7R22_16870 [Subtercola boreus]
MMTSSPHEPYPSFKWVRGTVDNTTVVNSHAQLLVWEQEIPIPRYLFNRSDVAHHLLRQTRPPKTLGYHHPNGPVDAWFDVVLNGRTIRHGAWRRTEFPDHLGVTWEEGAFDLWQEEDEVVVEHPHDPFVHIDALPSSRVVTVSHRGITVASSDAPILLWETGLPVRYYIPREDVDFTHLYSSATRSTCPYKGFATEYWCDSSGTDIAWSYPQPFFPYRNIANRVAFLNESVDITADGLRQPRPETKTWPGRARLLNTKQ